MAVVRVRYSMKRYGGGEVHVDRQGFGWAWYAESRCRVVGPIDWFHRAQVNHFAGREIWGDGGVLSAEERRRRS